MIPAPSNLSSTARADNLMKVVVIGGGPAGLMAAEAAGAAGVAVDLYDGMPSLGRKFLLAGKGGLNLTHAESFENFCTRYGESRPHLEPLIRSFGFEEIRAWASALGISTFVGSSRRVFPLDMKAAPLLRAWVRRLKRSRVQFHMRHRWQGWGNVGQPIFATPCGTISVAAEAVILALGGASWPNLGSDAAWVPILAAQGVRISPLRPSNCGFDVQWTEHFRSRFAGHPVKSIAARVGPASQISPWWRGDCVITQTGLEGGVVYQASSPLRNCLETSGSATLLLDLSPDWTAERLIARLGKSREKRTIASHLARTVGIEGVKAGLLREVLTKEEMADTSRLAAALKELPIRVIAPRPINEAISTAGGVSFDALDDRLMLRNMPGVFCAGEMLDWDAPTGGYLLTACLATGRAAGLGAAEYVKQEPQHH